LNNTLRKLNLSGLVILFLGFATIELWAQSTNWLTGVNIFTNAAYGTFADSDVVDTAATIAIIPANNNFRRRAADDDLVLIVSMRRQYAKSRADVK